MKKAVLSLSGGMDSSTLLIHLLANDYEVTALGFDYGQKHKVELERATSLVKYLKENNQPVTHQIIKLDGLTKLLNSALVEGGKDVPEGHYEQDNMKETVVPNRNKIFASLIQAAALSWATRGNLDDAYKRYVTYWGNPIDPINYELYGHNTTIPCFHHEKRLYTKEEFTEKIKTDNEFAKKWGNKQPVEIAMGIHAGDHAIYPDCRQEFRDADFEAFKIGNWDSDLVSHYTPYLEVNKFDILKDGLVCCEKLGLDFDEVYKRTNTSYKPIKHYYRPETHAFKWYSDYKSAASVERIEAFLKLGRPDPVEYADETGPVSWEVAKAHVEKVLAEYQK